MNTDFWASRLAAAKRQYALQHHHNSSQLGLVFLLISMDVRLLFSQENWAFCFFFCFFFLFLYFIFGLDRLSIDDFEVEDEARPDFPCPYCYEDYDIASLCSHLEDEHSCESRVTVRGFAFLFY